jgi:PAS domain S-box-containing protein
MERADLEQWKAREVARLLALVETERRYYQEIVASIPVGLLVLSADLNIISSNREIRRIFRLRSGDSLRGRLDALLPASTLDAVREVLATGKAATNLSVAIDAGGPRTVRVSIQTIRNWEDEGQQEALVTIIDSESEGNPDDAAGQTKDAAADLLKHVDAVIWAAELPAKRFLYVNEKAQELLGYPAEKWLHTPSFWADRIHPDDRERVLTWYQHAIDNWNRKSCEYRVQTSNGRTIWLNESVRLLRDEESGTRHLIGIATDVTERRLLEAQIVRAQRMEALTRLSGRVSHEIENLLMIVGGYAEELIGGLEPGSPLRADMQEIVAATERLRSLSAQLSSLTRKPAQAPGPVDLNELLLKVEPSLRASLGAAVELEMKRFPTAAIVNANADQLREVVQGLVERARRAMPGGGKITIDCSPFEIDAETRPEATLRPGAYAVLAIEDTGTSLDAEAMASAFEPLGAPALSRLYLLARHWGGDIAVAGRMPQGTVFRVFLPLLETRAATERATAPTGVTPRVPAPVSAPEPIQQTILVIEDEPGIRGLIRKILRRQGYDVLEAANREEGLKLCDSGAVKIHLLIADLAAAPESARELLEKMRAHFPNAKALLVSGYADEAPPNPEDFPSGTAFLQKPFTLGSLVNRVKEVLEA